MEPDLPDHIISLLSDMSCRERRKWVDAWARHRRRVAKNPPAVVWAARHREFCPLSPEVLALVDNPELVARARDTADRRRATDRPSLFDDLDAERAHEVAAREMGLADEGD